jgi:hypothetical protein
VAELGLRGADFHHPPAGEGEEVEVVLGVEERHGVGGAPGGARHEDGAVLALEGALDPSPSLPECLGEGPRLARDLLRFGNEDELPRAQTIAGLDREGALRGEREGREVLERADFTGIEVRFREALAVVLGKGHHFVGEIGAQAPGLQIPGLVRRERIPAAGETTVAASDKGGDDGGEGGVHAVASSLGVEERRAARSLAPGPCWAPRDEASRERVGPRGVARRASISGSAAKAAALPISMYSR